MKKQFLLFFIIILSGLTADAQISSYGYWDNEESAAYKVEELDSYEIKAYNNFIKDGYTDYQALLYINAARAHTNLECAPATIIDIHFTSAEIDETDSIPDAIGACNVGLSLINTTPKTIKEITLQFEFEHLGSPVYDIKTGDKYLTLKFQNLKGRTKSYQYNDILKTIMDCYHNLEMNQASYKKLFYNKTASAISLYKVTIVYADGSHSNKVSIFDDSYNNYDIFHDGPLAPIVKFVASKNDMK